MRQLRHIASELGRPTHENIIRLFGVESEREDEHDEECHYDGNGAHFKESPDD
jgi:hypothetical protein